MRGVIWMAGVSEAQKKAQRKYMEKDVEVKVRMSPDKRTIVQEHAKKMNESATEFINRAIDEAIARDRQLKNETE